MTAPQTTKREHIVETLRRQILSGDLPRGARMRQDELARQFAASITPVREALRLLEAEGLLVSEPHRGARVAGIGLEQMKATYVVRRLVESYAMQRATTRLSLRDLSQARAMIENMQVVSDRGDVEAFRSENRAFHFFFYERCGMPSLTERMFAMWQAFPWDLMLDTPQRTRQSHLEHIEILRAFESADVDRVAAATEAHIAAGFNAIAARLSGSDEPVPDPFLLDVD
jgi:DNA-binding GntR family transcriptional regulator